MILTAQEIIEHCYQYKMVSPFDAALVNPCTLDVRIGKTAKVEIYSQHTPFNRDWKTYNLEEGPLTLLPGHFVLVATLEEFNLPQDVCAEFMLKSSRAREGYGHIKAGFCDPGWHGSVLTMELHNLSRYAQLPITMGMRIGQMLFSKLNRFPLVSYSNIGHYNNDLAVENSWEEQTLQDQHRIHSLIYGQSSD